MNPAPTVTDKTEKPAGLLPKHVQSWLLLGLAVAMVSIMWLTGGKKNPSPARSTEPLAAPPLEFNEAKIVELQKRIEQLQREQGVAQAALAAETREPAAPSTAGSQPADALREERQKRDYVSLFASNVALSYRKAPSSIAHETVAPPPAPDPTMAQIAELLRPVAAVPPVVKPREEEHAGEKGKPPLAPPAATGNSYVLFEGTVIETVLLNRLDGQFSGPVACLVTTDLYSHDRQHLLVPAGSKVLGEARKVEAFGQTRLAVFFHRLLMPDGYSVSLDRFAGLDQIGDAGLRDQVNNHYARIFGVSLAIGAIGAVAEAGTAGALTASGSDMLRQGFAQSMGQSAAQILDRFLNVPPTITIREGHRVKIYLSGDFALPDYANHAMPSNL